MKTIKTNPILEKVERGVKLGAQLTGYKATSREKGIFKLARDLSAEHCYLIPEKNIMHWEYINEKDGHIHIYLEEETEAEEVFSRVLSAHSPTPRDKPIQLNEPWFTLANSRIFTPLLPPIWLPVRNPACEAACIKKIISGVGFTKIIPGSSPDSASIILTAAGIIALINCLRNDCGLWGYVLDAAFVEAVVLIQGNVSVGGDPDLPDIPQFPFSRT